MMISYRRSQFADPSLPTAGVILQSKSGKSLLRVTKATLFRQQGKPPARDMIRLTVDRMSAGSQPDGAVILPWPIRRPVATPAIPPVPAAVRFKAVVAAQVQPKSRKQAKRDLATQARIFQEERDSAVPSAQRHAVMSPDGSLFSPPKVVNGQWRDPEQAPNTRSPKMTSGFKPYDPLAALAKKNSSITLEHVTAADFYRMACERGPGGAISGGRELTFSDRQFAPSMGPAEFKLEAMAAWNWVQNQLAPPAKACLEATVLQRQSVAEWAEKRGGDRRYAVGYLTSVLDQLLVIYSDDVHAHLRQERVTLD